VTRRLFTVVIAASLVASCSAGDDDTPAAPPTSLGTTSTTGAPRPERTPGCEREDIAQPGVFDRTMTSGGVERRFQLHVPDAYDGRTPLPVVFALHGLTVNYAVVPAVSGFADVEARYDFVAVSPSGRLNGTTPYWLAAPADDNYDVTFISDLLDLLATDLCIDTARVFSTGMSNGGQMSSLLACQLSERITAVAPVAGVEFSDQCDGRPVPVMAFHGTDDRIVTYEGGGLNAATISDQHYWKGAIPAGLPEHEVSTQQWAIGPRATGATWNPPRNACRPRSASARGRTVTPRRCSSSWTVAVTRGREEWSPASRRRSVTSRPTSTRRRSCSSSSSRNRHEARFRTHPSRSEADEPA
jgi:poly(3-hydroxybutyrate) depolymerase